MTSNFGRGGRGTITVLISKQDRGSLSMLLLTENQGRDYERGGYGNYIVIRHKWSGNSLWSFVQISGKRKCFVKSGQPIVWLGNTVVQPVTSFRNTFLGHLINPNFIVDFNKVCHRDEYVVTNSSFKKTTASSRSVLKPGESYQASSDNNDNTNNKYVSGEVQYHRIKKGDTLSGIAKLYGISVKKICNLNNITTKTILRPGKSLRIS